MAESQVVSGLLAKRGELAGEVEHYQRELQRLTEALGHVDAAIRLFDPSYQVSESRTKKWGYRTQRFGPGECQRLVLEVLREATEPLSSHELAQAVAAHEGLEPHREVPAQLKKTASAVRRRLVAKGVVRPVVLADGRRAWERS